MIGRMMIPYHGYEAPTALPHTSYTGHHHHPAQETPEPVPKYTRSVSDLTLSLTKYKERLFVAIEKYFLWRFIFLLFSINHIIRGWLWKRCCDCGLFKSCLFSRFCIILAPP